MRRTPGISLTRWLVFLALGALIPLLLFAGGIMIEMSRTSREARDGGQRDMAQSLALAVDGEVHSWKAVLTALAESKSIRPDRLAEFYEEARQVALPHEGWVVLTVASGEQLVNTLQPYGAPLHKTSSPETIDAIFREGKPVVSDLFYGRNTRGHLVAVAVPVVRNGKVIHCLTLNFAPDRLSRLLQRQPIPASWVFAITDRQERVIARSRLIEQRIGKPLVDWLAAAVRGSDDGLVSGALSDGRLGQVAFQRLQEVPWTVMVAIPVAELPSTRPVWGFFLGSLVVGVMVVGAVVVIGRRVARPISRLAQATIPLLRGEPADLGPLSGVSEVRSLQAALGEAASAIRNYYQARERAAVAEERARAAASSEEALRRLNVELEARVAARTGELSRAIQTLERQARQLRALAAELTLAEQRERRRLADLLHDELQQLLVATRLRTHMLGRAADPAVREGADEVVALIEEALAITRTLTAELQPPALQRGSLLLALEWLARWMAEKHHLAVRLEPPAAPLPPLPEELAVLLYRAARELLLNAVKHAQATEAVVTVTHDAATLAVTVADGGVGFDPARLRITGGSEGGYGLLATRERLEWVGGRLELASAPGQGSRIGLVVPLGPAPGGPLRPST